MIFCALRIEDESLLLRLRPDDDPSQPALVRAAGFTLSYLDVRLGPRVAAGLKRFVDAFARAAGDDRGEVVALAALQRAVATTFPSGVLAVKRRLPDDQRVLRGSLAMRSGAPHTASGRLWPYDTETTAMGLGLRRLVLRETQDEGEAAADVRWLEGQGLIVRRADNDRDGVHLHYAARDEETLARAIDMHRASCGTGEDFQDAARWMGEALGYPRCCVEAFSRVRSREDLVMFADLLPKVTGTPTSPLAGFLLGSLTLVSHAPCSPGCVETRALAAAVLEAIDRSRPGFADLWDGLARRVHVISIEGRAFALSADGGALSTGTACITDAVELMPPEPDDLAFARIVRPAPQLLGAQLQVVDHQLVATASGREVMRAGLVADQRAARG
jgi:hypothetical protein